VESTSEGYPSDTQVSNRAWRWTVFVLAATIGAILLALAVIATQPDVHRGVPIWPNAFDQAPDEWTIDPEGGSVANGILRLHPPTPDSTALAIHPLPVRDFIAETKAKVIEGSANNGYGIVVGDQGDLTAFLIGGDGYISVMRQAGHEWIELQPWRQWPHIRRGNASNKLRVECRGSACALYINDEPTVSAEVGRGRTNIGLLAWRYTMEKLTIESESLQVWAISGSGE
jgi:hypothetical protein